MTYHFDDLKEELLREQEVYISFDNLQPIQIGRCLESQKRINKGLRTNPINVWPIDNGENYAILDGLHTNRDDYDSGVDGTYVSLGHDLNSEIQRFYYKSGFDADLSILEQWLGSEISKIQLKADFVRSEKGIYHVRDTEILYPTTRQLLEMNDQEFDNWVLKNAT